MKKQDIDAKKMCLQKLMASGSMDQIAKALAVENRQVYARYDMIHRAR